MLLPAISPADSKKHHDTGVALPLEALLTLPAMVSVPEAVLLEKTTGDLLMVYPADDGRKVKIIVRMDHKLKKQPQKPDAVINVFKINAVVLKSEKLYEVMSGQVE